MQIENPVKVVKAVKKPVARESTLVEIAINLNRPSPPKPSELAVGTFWLRRNAFGPISSTMAAATHPNGAGIILPIAELQKYGNGTAIWWDIVSSTGLEVFDAAKAFEKSMLSSAKADAEKREAKLAAKKLAKKANAKTKKTQVPSEPVVQ